MSTLERNTRTFHRGTIVFMEGDVGREMFVITEGKVLLYQVIGKKVRQDSDVVAGYAIREIATVQDGDFFGEMALLDHQTRSTCAVALSDVSCLVLDESNFGQVLAARPDFSLRLMREFSRRVRELEELLKSYGWRGSRGLR